MDIIVNKTNSFDDGGITKLRLAEFVLSESVGKTVEKVSSIQITAHIRALLKSRNDIVIIPSNQRPLCRQRFSVFKNIYPGSIIS